MLRVEPQPDGPAAENGAAAVHAEGSGDQGSA